VSYYWLRTILTQYLFLNYKFFLSDLTKIIQTYSADGIKYHIAYKSRSHVSQMYSLPLLSHNVISPVLFTINLLTYRRQYFKETTHAYTWSHDAVR